MSNATASPQPGDVLAFPIERIGKHGALQIVAVHEADRQVTVAVLDWIGEHEPTIDEVRDAPRMVKDFMFWSPSEITSNVALPIPSEYRRIGALPVHGETESRSYGSSWRFDSDLVRQHRWNTLPPELTARFKAALDSDDTVTVPGLYDERTGGPVESKLGSLKRFTDDGAYTISDEFRMNSLRSWPVLYQVHLRSWRDDLIPFLEASPLVSEVQLTGHGQRVIDLSRTHVDHVNVDVTGLERLLLPESVEQLILRGDPGGKLRIEAAERGRWISLHLPGRVLHLSGMERVNGLRIGGVTQLSLAEVAQHHPEVGYLHLFGAPGTLHELPALGALPRLEALWICDLFGYGPEDFPGPDRLPALTGLDLDSIPAEVAASVRRIYKKHPRVELSVRKPRKPEWLAENLENPLRHWDGRDGIPASVAKKARTAFITALRQVREADTTYGSDAAAYDAATTTAITAFLGVIAVLNRKHGFLYTLERDEVIDAVNALAAKLSPEADRALEPTVEEALDD